MNPPPAFGLPHQKLEEIFATGIQTLPTTPRFYRIAAHRFLSYLQTDFPSLLHLSELRRAPHLLGWLQCLNGEDPPLSNSTRRIYLIGLRRLLHDLASAGHTLQPGLILTEDFPPHPPRQPKPRPTTNDRRPQPPPPPLQPKPSPTTYDRHPPLSQLIFGEIFDARIQALSTTLRPGTTAIYHHVARHFLSYLQTDFPQLLHLSELRRDPHLFGWLRRLCEKTPPLSNATRCGYLLNLRRLLNDLSFQGHGLQPELILPEDFPPQPQYLPRALPPEEDRQLQQELSRTNDLFSNALLLTRATGIRIGECIHLDLHCLRPLAQNQWGLHVPLGKLYTERLVPADEHVRQIVTRILALRAVAPASHLAQSPNLLLPRPASSLALYRNLSRALHQAAMRAGCPHPITCHQLRHTYASEMICLGVSLPALMQLLGHKHIRMTMRYVLVTQQDLQREFHLARQKALHHHHIPQLPVPSPTSASPDLPSIQRALTAIRHLMEMYRRQLQDEKATRKLRRLDKRLLNVAFALDRLATPEK
jgi:site-specific recombinase XerD